MFLVLFSYLFCFQSMYLCVMATKIGSNAFEFHLKNFVAHLVLIYAQ